MINGHHGDGETTGPLLIGLRTRAARLRGRLLNSPELPIGR